MKKRWALFICLFSVALMVAPPQIQGAEKTIKMGVVAALSGAGAIWGTTFNRTFQLQAEQINAAGGLQVGGEKYKIELIPLDDKWSASEAVNVTNRLIFKEKVNFLFGSLGSTCAMAMVPIIRENKMITITGSYTPKILGPDKPYTFRGYASSGEIFPPLFAWIKQNYPNVKRMGILYANDEGGWAQVVDYETNIQAQGFELVTKDSYERNTVDYVPVLTRMLDKKLDLIILEALTGDLGMMSKQLRQMGFKGPSVTGVANDVERLVKIGGVEGMEGLILPNAFLTPGGVQKWADEYLARHKSFDIATMLYVDYFDWLIHGIKVADSLDPEKVRVALESGKFVSRLYGPLEAGGKMRYGNNHQLIPPIPISVIRQGKGVGLSVVPGMEPGPIPQVKK